jgi:hypothetical protein
MQGRGVEGSLPGGFACVRQGVWLLCVAHLWDPSYLGPCFSVHLPACLCSCRSQEWHFSLLVSLDMVSIIGAHMYYMMGHHARSRHLCRAVAVPVMHPEEHPHHMSH